MKRNTQITSSEDVQNTVNEDTAEGVDEFANLQDLVSVKNKTEEELQEINKKEIEKSKVSKNENKTFNDYLTTTSNGET